MYELKLLLSRSGFLYTKNQIGLTTVLIHKCPIPIAILVQVIHALLLVQAAMAEFFEGEDEVFLNMPSS